MMTTDSDPSEDVPSALLTSLTELDQETLTALGDIVADSPELLEQVLEDYGYLEEDIPDGDERPVTNREETQLTSAQRGLVERLSEGMGNPRTADQIVSLIDAEYPEFLEEYRSARHRSWINEQLNTLVEAGEMGRFRDGRNVYYTRSVTDAIRQWAPRNNRFVEELSVTDTSEIADSTGMPARYVRPALKELVDEVDGDRYD